MISKGTIGEIVESLDYRRASQTERAAARSYDNTYKLAVAKSYKCGVRVFPRSGQEAVAPPRVIPGAEIAPMLKRAMLNGDRTDRKYKILSRLAARDAKSPWIAEPDLVFLRLASRPAA